jgi:hypothetical protein
MKRNDFSRRGEIGVGDASHTPDLLGKAEALSARSDAATLDSGEDFRQRIFDNGKSKGSDFLQTVPAASDERFLVVDKGRIEPALVKRSFDNHRREVVGDDVLSERRIATDVPFFGCVKHLGIQQADHVTQVKIAVRKLGHILATHVAQITFVALGHGRNEGRGIRSERFRAKNNRDYCLVSAEISLAWAGYWAISSARLPAVKSA